MTARSPSWTGICTPTLGEVGHHVGRIRATQQRIQIDARTETVGAAGGVVVGRVVGRRDRTAEVDRDAELVATGRARGGSHPLGGQAVAEEQVVGGGDARPPRSRRPGACTP